MVNLAFKLGYGPLRTYARDEAQKYKGSAIKDNISPIGEAITLRADGLTMKVKAKSDAYCF